MVCSDHRRARAVILLIIRQALIVCLGMFSVSLGHFLTFCGTAFLVLDALRAHDTYTARCKGAQTRKTDLNLPEEWAFPSPFGICSPVHLCGDYNDRNQRKRRHNSERKDTVRHSSNQSASSAHRQRKCETDSLPPNLTNSASAIHSKHIIGKSQASQFKVIEFIEPPGTSTSKKRGKGVEHESRKKVDCNPGVPTITTGYLKPCIKKGEKVYACWGVRNGLGQEWFPGRVWDVKEYAIGDYGPQHKYDVVYDDGDTESNVQEIWVMKKNEYEMGIKKPEESWIGVTNVTFPESKDNYAKLIGWYKLTCDGDHPVYSSLGDALRAHDKVMFRICFGASQICIQFSHLFECAQQHIIETKGQEIEVVQDLNFPEERCVIKT